MSAPDQLCVLYSSLKLYVFAEISFKIFETNTEKRAVITSHKPLYKKRPTGWRWIFVCHNVSDYPGGLLQK